MCSALGHVAGCAAAYVGTCWMRVGLHCKPHCKCRRRQGCAVLASEGTAPPRGRLQRCTACRASLPRFLAWRADRRGRSRIPRSSGCSWRATRGAIMWASGPPSVTPASHLLPRLTCAQLSRSKGRLLGPTPHAGPPACQSGGRPATSAKQQRCRPKHKGFLGTACFMRSPELRMDFRTRSSRVARCNHRRAAPSRPGKFRSSPY